MKSDTLSIIDAIKHALQSNSFDTKDIDNGIRVNIGASGFTTNVVDVCALPLKSDEIRARILYKSEEQPLEEPVLQYIHKKLQKILTNIVDVQEFDYLGQRDDYHVYYTSLARVQNHTPGASQLVDPESDNNDGQPEKKNDIASEYPDLPELKDPPEHLLLEEDEPEPEPEPEIHKLTPAQVLEQLKGIDSKTFRQGLDDIGLPRTCVTRMILSRVFRDAIDEDAFEETIKTEATEVIRKNEFRVLMHIKNNSVPFLQNLTRFLCEEVASQYRNRANAILER